MTNSERNPDAPPLLSVIGSTVVMKGDLEVGEDLVIEGTYTGTIHASDTVTVRRTARLSGQVAASHVRVEGGFKLDKLTLSGHISLTPGNSKKPLSSKRLLVKSAGR